MPDIRSHIRNKSPLKGHYAQAYKLGDPSPIGYREGTRNTGATITINKEPAPYQESAAKAIKDRGPLTQVEIDYIYHKIGR